MVLAASYVHICTSYRMRLRRLHDKFVGTLEALLYLYHGYECHSAFVYHRHD